MGAMPPHKRKMSPGIKQEKQEDAKPFCVAGLEGKALASKVEYTLRAAPEHIKRAWEQSLKKLKTGSSEAKQEFIKHLLEEKGTGWQSSFFTKISKISHVESHKQSGKWLSWKQVLEREPAVVAEMMIKQQKMRVRPHEMLDHSLSETKALEWHDQHQSCYQEDVTENVCAEDHSEMRTQHQDQSMDDAPDAEKPAESPAQIFVQKKGSQDDAAEGQE